MPNEGLSVGVGSSGVRETLGAFRDLPKDATKELRKAALELSRELARYIAAAGTAEGGQAAALAPTVKAKFDRIPAVVIGGAKPVGRNRSPATDLVIGSEFGHAGQGGRGKGTRDYAPHGFRPRNATGLWIFPTLVQHRGDIAARWQAAAEAIVEQFSEGG